MFKLGLGAEIHRTPYAGVTYRKYKRKDSGANVAGWAEASCNWY